jgi:putative transposase
VIASTVLRVVRDLLQLLSIGFRSHTRLAAENLFLLKQLALYMERGTKPRRASNATRVSLVILSRFIDWRPMLTIVQPATLVRWHRQAFRLFWRWRSRPRGRPRVPRDLQQLIAEMAGANRTWGEERIAAELLLKLGISVSPRTVRRYMRRPPWTTPGTRSQSWNTFVRNHAHEPLACDFFVVVTARFNLLYVFVLLDIETRRLVHRNVTDHPTAAWTVQQFRNALADEHLYRFLVHDRDTIYSRQTDRTLNALGLHVLRTPVGAPQTNAYCERLIGTVRRECLDWMIPIGEGHVRRVLAEWATHYNRGRPHAGLGPGLPDSSSHTAPTASGHQVPVGRLRVKSILRGLHHEYSLDPVAA